jgi:phosphatidylglycerol:prolipoprotein diacylglycerol transferase
MFDLTPDPIAFQIGPLPVYWYGIGYALGLAAVYVLLTRLAPRAGEDPDLVGNGMIIVAIAALIGGRLYHVIDQWDLYKDDLLSIVLPPYTGLGVYGGLLTGLVAVVAYTRYKGVSFWRWADIVAPGLFLMQAIARWGNFFNQELYGPPTSLPWGIPIDCEHRVAAYACEQFPLESTRFHPLFLYESLSGLLGMLFLLWLGARYRSRLRPGDIILVFFIWYAAVRFALEALRSGNWTVLGIPTAQIVSLLFIAVAAAVLVWRHRPGHPTDDGPPSRPALASWGAAGPSDWRMQRIDEPWAHAGDLSGGVERTPEELGIGAPDDAAMPDDVEGADDAATPDRAALPGSDEPGATPAR